ncbi:MAG: ATP phosphoribosyltransferase [Chlamydiia bacterium]|nr:ATP phosphoribosyltransferase [Chlamydiia bacterium]
MEYITRSAEQIILGIPSKGRLKSIVIDYLASHGYPVRTKERQLQGEVEDQPQYKVVFAHPKDIPIFLDKGVLDVGFTGLDMIHETQSKVRPVIKTGGGYVKMSIMVPETKPHYHPFHLLDQTIGTPFPNITRAYFDQLKVRVNVQPILGASEGMPYLGLVDAIVDVVETGTSARENGLKVVANDLFDSECVVAVKTPEIQENHRIINDFLRSLYQ